MPAPKGHAPYEGCEKGGKFGYLGCPENCFTDEELHALGLGVVDWIKQKNNIWMKFYFQLQGIHWNTVEKLRKRSEMFAEYLDMAKSIQESKLLTEPYLKKADQNMARFILARHHKGEWEDKQPSLDLNPGTANITIIQYSDKADESESKADE